MRPPRGEPREDPARLGWLRELGLSLLLAESSEELAEQSVRHIRELFGSQHVSLVRFDREAAQATVVASYFDRDTKGGGGSRWDIDAFGPQGRFMAGRSIGIEDVRTATDLPTAVLPLARANIRSLVEVPVGSAEGLVGLIVVGSIEPSWFGPEDVQTLEAAAEMIASALTRARRVEEALRQATLAERAAESLERALREQRTLLSQVAVSNEHQRQRLAMDIHDDPVQVMTVAGTRLQALRDRLGGETLGGDLKVIEDMIRAASGRLRHLMFELLPPTLEREGLGPALSLYLERMRDDGGPDYVFESRLQGQAPPEMRTAMYRIAQEAARNVLQHAGATRLSVLLDRRDGGVWLQVSDDGVGFSIEDVESRLPLHLGLTAMRLQAELAGGWCRIRSVPGGGTVVEAWIPGELREGTGEGEVSATPA